MSEPPVEVVYTFRPSLLGAPREFKLAADGLRWTAGSRSGRVPFRDVRRVRLSYRPVSMQAHRFVTEVWAEGAPKLEIVSSSWKSMVEQVRQDQPYADFVRELHRRVAAAAAPARFEQGRNPLFYWTGLAVFAAVALAIAALAVRALQAGAVAGALFILAFLALFLWQGGNFLRRNRPGTYRPDALPELLMPRV